MNIQVLGSGCPTCKKLYELTQQAVHEMNSQDSVEYITGDKGLQKIMELGVMQSPVLAVDGKPVMVGFVPDVEKIKKAILSGKKMQSNVGTCSCGGKC